jgi:hypothetical protein
MMVFRIYKNDKGFYFTGNNGKITIGLDGIPSIHDALVIIGMEISKRDIRFAEIYSEDEILTKLRWLNRE